SQTQGDIICVTAIPKTRNPPHTPWHGNKRVSRNVLREACRFTRVSSARNARRCIFSRPALSALNWIVRSPGLAFIGSPVQLLVMQFGTFMKARCGPIQYRRSRTREDTPVGANIGNFGVLGDPVSDTVNSRRILKR